MSSVPIGQYFLPPFSAPSHKLKTTDEVILPVVPEVQLLKPQPEQKSDDHKELGMLMLLLSKYVFLNAGFLRIDQLPIPMGTVFEFIAKQNGCSVKKRETTRTKQ